MTTREFILNGYISLLDDDTHFTTCDFSGNYANCYSVQVEYDLEEYTFDINAYDLPLLANGEHPEQQK